MTTFTQWRFRFGIAFGVYVGFLFGGIIGAIGVLPWMISSLFLSVIVVLLAVLWFWSIVPEDTP